MLQQHERPWWSMVDYIMQNRIFALQAQKFIPKKRKRGPKNAADKIAPKKQTVVGISSHDGRQEDGGDVHAKKAVHKS